MWCGSSGLSCCLEASLLLAGHSPLPHHPGSAITTPYSSSILLKTASCSGCRPSHVFPRPPRYPWRFLTPQLSTGVGSLQSAFQRGRQLLLDSRGPQDTPCWPPWGLSEWTQARQQLAGTRSWQGAGVCRATASFPTFLQLPFIQLSLCSVHSADHASGHILQPLFPHREIRTTR